MELFIQVAATGGPIALAMMGLYMSVRPPSATGKIHWPWFIAFAILGIIATAANFIELHGTDVSLAEIKTGIEQLLGHKTVHPDQPPVLAIDCHPALLPNFAPPEGVNTLDLFHSEGGAEIIGLGSSITQPGQLLGWYEDRKIFPILRCDLSNKEPMYSVVLNLHAKFSKFVSSPSGVGSIGEVVYERDWPIAIAEIDSNKPFSFYAYTSSVQYAVNAQFLDATFLSVDTNERVKAHLLTLGFPLTFYPATMNATSTQK